MKELWLLLLGSTISIVGGLLGARWSAKYQRSNLLHESRISLYVDLTADYQRREAWLDALCDSYLELKKLGKAYQPAVPLEARIELLALERTKGAWRAVEDAQARLRLLAEQEGYPTHDEDLMLPGSPEVVGLRQALVGLREAIHRDLRKG
ncbi:hypothetical protein AB0L22_09170 [Micromonospora haikouensis]|uniref:hypothetical protein n=1 Tax=Micromonospora haikouensis TaxID=686309 RepID=UPI00343F5DBB